MGKEVKVDYSALQGDSFFGISKQYMDYIKYMLDRIKLNPERTAGNVAVYGLIAHKKIMEKSVLIDKKNPGSLFDLYCNSERLMNDLGVKFEQIDEKLKNAIK